MLKDAKGSPNGIITRSYDKGNEYDLPESLANAFVNDLKVAKLTPKSKAELSEEEKLAAEAEAKAKAEAAKK